MINKFEKSKLRYLDGINSENENSKKVYERVFNKAEEMEEKLDKDIFDFNEKELELFIGKYLNPMTRESARTYCNILSSYIQWSIDAKLSKSLTNPIRKRQEYFYNFVQNQEELYLSKNKIDALIASLRNAQDYFLVQALFEGLQGAQVSEITSLTIDQIRSAKDNDNILVVVNKSGKSREIEVSDDLINFALIANSDLEYIKSNGEFNSEEIADFLTLPKSKYILKSSVRKDSAHEKEMSINTVYTRINTLKNLDSLREFKKALSTKNLSRSGMLWEAKKVLDSGRLLTRGVIEGICEKFGVNYKWSITEDFLNEETIKKIYKNNSTRK